MEGPLDGITMAEVSRALESLKDGKAAGPSEITTEMFKHAGNQGLCLLVDLLQKVMQMEESPTQWSHSITIPLYKGKGDALDCSKYRGLRLLEHGMKIYEKVLVNRLLPLIKIKNNQFGFTAGKSTTDAIFILRSLQEKFLQKNKQLFHIFVDLEKAFDRVPRRAIEWALRRQLVPERLITLIMSLYSNSSSQVRIAGVLSDRFPVSVGVHQGTVLSPILFNIVMEEVTKECGVGDPWEMLYADDLVITAETKQDAVEKFGKWQEAMEHRGLKINLGKTKLLITGKKHSELPQSGKYPCAVCGLGSWRKFKGELNM